MGFEDTPTNEIQLTCLASSAHWPRTYTAGHLVNTGQWSELAETSYDNRLLFAWPDLVLSNSLEIYIEAFKHNLRTNIRMSAKHSFYSCVTFKYLLILTEVRFYDSPRSMEILRFQYLKRRVACLLLKSAGLILVGV